jgi:PAS domain S-box-containing protein
MTHGYDILEAVMASLADAVYLVGPAGDIRFANPVAVAILGYGAEAELIGRDSHATIHSRRRDGTPYPEQECPLLRPRQSGETVRVELDWFVRRDGDLVPVGYASAPVETEDGRGAVVVFRDMTERLAAEAARTREVAARARAEELAASRARIVNATDAERRRIGRDLHDGAQQRLVRALMAIEEARRALGHDRERADEALARGAAEARHAITDLRDLSAGIHPLVLTDRGVGAALEELTAEAPVAVALDVTEERLAPELEAAAYFLVAEALTNVAKHAHAGAVEVSIRREGGVLRIVVADDGRGGADPATGSGLRGLYDRVAVLDGTLEIDSSQAGTTLRATLPL